MITSTAATAEQLQARLGLRSSSAASKHVNRKRQAQKGVGKGGRKAWKRDI